MNLTQLETLSDDLREACDHLTALREEGAGEDKLAPAREKVAEAVKALSEVLGDDEEVA